MRFAFVVLLSTVALLAGNNALAAADVNHNEISQVVPPEAVHSVAAEQNAKRFLRSDKTEEKVDNTDEKEEKGLIESVFNNFRRTRTCRRWYVAGLTPKEVNSMLKTREAEGEKVDWAAAAAYPRYYRRARYDNWLLYW